MPILQGKTCTLIKENKSAAGSTTKQFTLEAEAFVTTLFVESITGALDVSVVTFTEEGKESEIITFPTITAATSELVFKKAGITMSNIEVRVTYTGPVSYELRGRGLGAGEASVRIVGAENWDTKSASVSTTPMLLISSPFADRRGVNIRNYTTGSEVLFIAPSSAKVSSAADKYPLDPGESIGIDLQAGGEIWAVASTGTVDVRIIEVGD